MIFYAILRLNSHRWGRFVEVVRGLNGPFHYIYSFSIEGVLVMVDVRKYKYRQTYFYVDRQENRRELTTFANTDKSVSQRS